MKDKTNYILTTDYIKQYFDEIADIPVLTAKEEQELVNKLMEGDTLAKNKLIEHNLKLVVSIAKKYAGNGMSILDLIQEGNIGLIKATEKYEADKGTKFATYASYWIKQTIIKSICDKSRTIRIPVYLYNKIEKILKYQYNYYIKNGKYPTDKQLRETFDIDNEHLEILARLIVYPISLEKPFGEDENVSLKEVIEDPAFDYQEDFDKNVLIKEINNDFEAILSKLTENEKKVIELRYGLNGNKISTLKEASEVLNLSAERVRMLEINALVKIRKDKTLITLADSLNMKEKLERVTMEDEKKKESKRKKKTNIKTIFELLSTYKEEDIIFAIDQLYDDEKALIRKRYGDDLYHPCGRSLNKDETYEFYHKVISRIKRKIETMNRLKQENRIIYKKENSNLLEKYNEIKKKYNIVSLKYINPNLSIKEEIIIALRFGIGQEHDYSTNEIINILGVSAQEVISICKNFLREYKEELAELLNQYENKYTNKKSKKVI